MADFISSGGSQSMIAQVPVAALGPRGLRSIRVAIGRVEIPFFDTDVPPPPIFHPIFAIDVVDPSYAVPTRFGGVAMTRNLVTNRASFYLDGVQQNGFALPPDIQVSIRRPGGNGVGGSEELATGTAFSDQPPSWTSHGLIARIARPLAGRIEFWATAIRPNLDPNGPVVAYITVHFDRFGHGPNDSNQ